MQTHERPFPSRPEIWAVGGGKGGTGKSLVTASLAIHLAEMGRRVIVVDGDLGAPNLHSFFGLDAPPFSLSDLITRRIETPEEALYDTGLSRLRLLSGGRNALDVESLKHFQKTRLLRLLAGLRADMVLLDLGAGTSLNVLDLFSIADRGILVLLPEPTSVENGYRFLKAALLRRLQHLARTLGFRPVVDLVLRYRGGSAPAHPAAVLEEIRRVDSGVAERLSAHLQAFLPRLIVNQVRDHDDERIGDAIEAVCDRLLSIPIRFAGAVPYDPVLVRTVKRRRPFLLEYPRSRTAEAFRAAAEAIGELSPTRRGPAPRLAGGPETAASWRPHDPYAVLDLSPGASHDQVLAAYMRLRPVLRADSPALVSLDCEGERRAALADLEEAFRLLSRNTAVPWQKPSPRTPGHR